MALQPGLSLLHFRLVEKIGEGGMGEVWRAVDTTLDREVAVKVLPSVLAGDPERIARFEREAKVLAALNHPNIAGIYGFPEAEGQRFLAMEMVRGEDLAQILARGPLPVREAIDAARQIAAALEAAHDLGIVHRDLKPANVKRTPEGQIKVLDFGLAKALETAAPASGATATVTSAGTLAGMVLGTASYMSPEQARGQVVDRRTDLWAFGCVLYEMLTARRAFDGDTVTDVLAAVVQGEPDWERLPPGCPIPVRRLLRRCLEKDARKRLRDAGDASLLLEDNPEDARTGPVPPARSPRRLLLPGLALLVGLAGVAAGLWMAREGGESRAASAISFRRLTFARGMMRAARFAPDGHTVVYGAAWEGPPIKLYLARTESADAAPMPLPPAELLSISKNGEMAVALDYAFYGWMADGTLARTSLLGVSPREVVGSVRSADWSPDGTQLAIVRRVEGDDRLEYPLGKVLYKTAGYIADIRFSPDGQRIAFADHPQWGDNRGNLAMVDLSGKFTMLAEDFNIVQGVAWGPGGGEVWFTASPSDEGFALFACDLDGHRRVVYPSIGAIELFDVAADGRVLLGAERAERDAQALLAGDTAPRALVIPGESSIVRTMARDGSAVLVANSIPKEYETYLIRADRPGAVRLSEGESVGISPDGAWALCSSADYKTLILSPLGMGPTRKIPNPEAVAYESIAAWLPDSKRFVVTGRKGSEPQRAFLCEVASGACRAFGAPGLRWSFFTPPPVSPDGGRVALRDGNGAIAQWPVDGGPSIPIAGLLPDDQPLTWTEDGKGLFVAGRAIPIPIARLDLATGERTPWKTLSPTDRAGLRFAIPTIAPNGKYWALSVARLLTDLYVVEGLH